MNQEGGIYRESFHLTWAKIMGFPGAKKITKSDFFSQVTMRGAHFPSDWAHSA